MKRSWHFGLLVMVWLAACGAPAQSGPSAVPAATSAQPGELVDLNVCYSAPTTTQSVPWYAFEKGFFEKYGLRVNLIRVQGSSQAVTTLITGEADLCQAAGNSVVNAVAAGQDVVMIAGIYNTYPATLVARSEIKTLEDLKGKKVGTGLTGSASEVASRLAFQHLGLDPATDLVIVQIGEEPERVAAFQTGQIDALLTTSPYLHILRGQGVSELFDFGNAGIPYAHTSILTTRAFHQENRDTATRFLQAMIEAIAAIKGDPEGMKAVIAKYLELDVEADAADLSDAYDNIIAPLLRPVPYPNLEGLQTVIDFTAESNPDAANLKAADLVDLSILDELEQTGFLEPYQTK